MSCTVEFFNSFERFLGLCIVLWVVFTGIESCIAAWRGTQQETDE